MAQKKANRKIKKARQSQENRPATPVQTEITDPQKVNAELEQQVIKSTNGPVKGNSQKLITAAEKWTIYIMCGLLLVNIWMVWIMREDAKLEKRAWIGLNRPVPHPIKAGEKLSYQFVFTNTGKTPGIDTKVWSQAELDLNDSDILAFFEKDIPNDPNVGKAPLAPNASLDVSRTTGNEISESLFRRIESGETVVFVLVKIEYRDIFDESHKTHACLQYSPKRQTLIAYHKYNYMD